MKEQAIGPLLTDKEFFLECLNLDCKGMEAVKDCAIAGKYDEAKAAFADMVRKSLQPERFFTIPYEQPENIYRLPGESDEAVCARVLEHVLVSVGVANDFGKENPVDWYANPTFNQYREWTWQLNRHPELKLLAHEYRKHPDPRYAAAAAELFVSWVKQAVYPSDVSGRDTKCWRTIECGIRMGANWPYALFTFFRTEAFTDEVLVLWFKSMWEHGKRLYAHRTRSNWLIMEMNGLAHIGIICPWFRDSEKWLDSAFQSLSDELEKQIYPDGFQYELTTGYHDVVINNYQRILEMANAFGIPVLQGMSDKLSRACELNVKLMMPDGCLPSINDGKCLDVKNLLKRKLRILPEDEAVRWAASGGKNGWQPEYKSIALPYSGFMVMRTGWSKSDIWVLFDGAPFGRAHQHEDKLSVLFYAQGKLLLTEGGKYAYDTSEMRKYVLSTRGHNTVLVDGCGQNRRKDYKWEDEEINKRADLTWHIGKTFEYAESNYHEPYGEEQDIHVNHNRRVYFVKNSVNGLNPFLIVADRMESERSHDYKGLWHVDSEFTEFCKEVGRISFEEMDVYVSEAVSSVSIITGQEEPEWQGFVATGDVQGMYRPVPCIEAGFSGSRIRVITVLYPHAAENLEILKVIASEDIGDTHIEIELKDGKRIIYDEDLMKVL